MVYFQKDDDLWIGAMSEFSKSLDTMSNVFCLCPYCHRAVYHAEEP
jgi:predicted HNH restriction endonuclease